MKYYILTSDFNEVVGTFNTMALAIKELTKVEKLEKITGIYTDDYYYIAVKDSSGHYKKVANYDDLDD